MRAIISQLFASAIDSKLSQSVVVKWSAGLNRPRFARCIEGVALKGIVEVQGQGLVDGGGAILSDIVSNPEIQGPVLDRAKIRAF